MIKTLVITLYSGESEFEESKNSVLTQIDSEITHLVLEGLSELDAFNELYSIFEKEKEKFDFFVQVDADTIIDFPNAFRTVYSKVKSQNYSGAQLELYDFFTSKNINGLNFYIPSLNVFKTSNNKLFPERSVKQLSPRLDSNNFIEDKIIPVGRHCAYPNDKQSFHYGFHRGLKKRKYEYDSMLKSYENSKDRSRKIALSGFEYSKKFSSYSHDYSSNEFNDLYFEFMKNFDS